MGSVGFTRLVTLAWSDNFRDPQSNEEDDDVMIAKESTRRNVGGWKGLFVGTCNAIVMVHQDLAFVDGWTSSFISAGGYALAFPLIFTNYVFVYLFNDAEAFPWAAH